MTATKAFGGASFIQWLIDNEIIEDGDIRRVVIDAKYNNVTTIYVESLLSNRIIELDMPETLNVAVVNKL